MKKFNSWSKKINNSNNEKQHLSDIYEDIDKVINHSLNFESWGPGKDNLNSLNNYANISINYRLSILTNLFEKLVDIYEDVYISESDNNNDNNKSDKKKWKLLNNKPNQNVVSPTLGLTVEKNNSHKSKENLNYRIILKILIILKYLLINYQDRDDILTLIDNYNSFNHHYDDILFKTSNKSSIFGFKISQIIKKNITDLIEMMDDPNIIEASLKNDDLALIISNNDIISANHAHPSSILTEDSELPTSNDNNNYLKKFSKRSFFNPESDSNSDFENSTNNNNNSSNNNDDDSFFTNSTTDLEKSSNSITKFFKKNDLKNKTSRAASLSSLSNSLSNKLHITKNKQSNQQEKSLIDDDSDDSDEGSIINNETDDENDFLNKKNPYKSSSTSPMKLRFRSNSQPNIPTNNNLKNSSLSPTTSITNNPIPEQSLQTQTIPIRFTVPKNSSSSSSPIASSFNRPKAAGDLFNFNNRLNSPNPNNPFLTPVMESGAKFNNSIKSPYSNTNPFASPKSNDSINDQDYFF